MNSYATWKNRKKFMKDRFLNEKRDRCVDILIPTLNTNKFWKENLTNIYSNIPVNRLLIGDGGCTDDTLDVCKEFPRVEVFDHKSFKSQGKSIIELINQVETNYFIYLHSDVQLPEDWFDLMFDNRLKYDWFECHRKFVIDYEFFTEQYKHERAYSGSQFGNSIELKKAIQNIDDDYLQRNEDIIIAELVKNQGGKYGKVMETYHLHQLTNKKGELEPKIASVSIKKNSDKNWEKKIWDMQWRGLVKYTSPKSYLIENICLSILQCRKLNNFKWKDLRSFLRETNSQYSYLKLRVQYKKFIWMNILKGFAKTLAQNSRNFDI